MTKGKIYLIPTTLGESNLNRVLPNDLFSQINEIDHYIVENIRTARRYLKKLKITKEIDELTFYTLNKHTEINEISGYLNVAEKGENIGIISEAGCPGIADPGAAIVKIAHQKNIEVIPLVGPSSILLALIASGMNGQNFAFNGYLPVKKPEKIQKLKDLERKSKFEAQTQIFMEAPYRNKSLLDDILQNCNKSTLLCIAADITLETEFIKTKTIAQWKKQIPNINKRPAIFIIQA